MKEVARSDGVYSNFLTTSANAHATTTPASEHRGGRVSEEVVWRMLQSDTRGGSSDTMGGNSDTRGGSSDTRGGSSDTRGGSSDTRGGSSDTRGGGSDTRGGGRVTQKVEDSHVFTVVFHHLVLDLGSLVGQQMELADVHLIGVLVTVVAQFSCCASWWWWCRSGIGGGVVG